MVDISPNTKLNILSAARILFVEHGYSGTSIAKIAKLAGVNHSLIFHHFGNKEKLWLEVKWSIAREANKKKAVLPDTQLALCEFLRTLLHNTIRFYQDNPDIRRMIIWQQLEHPHYQDLGITRSEETNAWIAAINHYQGLGMINPKLSPAYIVSFILSLANPAILNQNALIDSANFDDYLDFCVERLRKSLV